MKACQPCVLRMSGMSCICSLAFGWVRGAWEASRSCVRSAFGRCGPRQSPRPRGRSTVPFMPFGRLGWSACMTERSLRAYGAVGATGAGRSRVRYVGPEIRGRSGQIGEIGGVGQMGEIGNLPKILPRFAEIEIRSDLKSFRFLGLLRFGKVPRNFKTRLIKFRSIVFSRRLMKFGSIVFSREALRTRRVA